MCLFWRGDELRVWVDSTATAAELAAISTSVDTWAAAASSCSDFTFSLGGQSSSRWVGISPDGGFNQNVILFRTRACSDVVPYSDPCWQDDACGNVHDCWQFSRALIAVPTVSYNPSTGKILDADIELNSSGFLFTTVDSPICQPGNINSACVAIDLRDHVMPMLGIGVGLGFLPSSTSTMHSVSNLGELSRRTVDPGTLMGLCAIYPRGRGPTSCDGGAAPPDDAGMEVDGGAPSDGDDAGATGSDAGGSSNEDGGPTTADGGPPTPDSALDAGTATADDAGSMADGGAVGGVVTDGGDWLDAGVVTDAGTCEPAQCPRASATPGCGCSTGAAPWLIAGLLWLRRRSSRGTQSFHFLHSSS